MAKIAVIGGLGTIGRMICPQLAKQHEVVILDAASNHDSMKVDASDYDALCRAVPDHTDVLINLISIKTEDELVPPAKFDEDVNAFLKSTYNIYHCAAEKNVKKVIFASSNHVTSYYEMNGESLLGREINVGDYPYATGLYGILKLASENIGHAFSTQHDIDVINLRIGTVRLNEQTEILKDVDRFQKTWLSEEDVIQIFEKAVETTGIRYGTYYAVSDNENKPWDTTNTVADLGFESRKNAADILREAGYEGEAE